jgi:hypothetical protein
MKTKSELQHYVTETTDDLSSQPSFPTDYCNVASKHLFDVLKQSWEKNIRLQHSYREPWDGHTYVVISENWKDIILDPTYAQYDSEFKNWFIGEHFPDKTLEKNRMEQKDFMKKQKEWFDDGVYDNL